MNFELPPNELTSVDLTKVNLTKDIRPKSPAATEIEMAKLRHILRGMRSRKQMVRDFALAEARALPLQQCELLVKITQSSFAKERRRKAFFRLAAFYGSSTLTGVIIYLLQWAPRFISHFSLVTWLVSFWGWLGLWFLADRSVRQAFTPDWDGRTIFLQEAEQQGLVTPTATAPKAPEQASRSGRSRTLSGPAEADDRKSFIDLLDRLKSEHEAERRQAMGQTLFLTTEELLTLAQMQFDRCRQAVEQEQNIRNKVCNVAYWAIFAAVLLHISSGFTIGIVAGLGALYFRSRSVELAVQGLAALLREVKELHRAPITLEMLTSEPDPDLLTTLKRRCPSLETLVQDHCDEPDAEQGVLPEETPALQAMSAEILATPYENVADALAALKRLERSGDETVLPIVERLAAMPARFVSVRTPIQSVADFRRDTQLLRDAAQKCLEAMHARLDIQTRTLLRASDAPSTSSPETLLRPMDRASGEVRADNLLRPHDPLEQTPTLPAVTLKPSVERSMESSSIPLNAGAAETRE